MHLVIRKRHHVLSEAFALATEREGSCNAVLEVLSCAVPVITTSAGDNANFVAGGVNDYLVPMDDAGAMEVALVRTLLCSEWDRQRTLRELQFRTWDEVGQEVIEFFREHVVR